MCPPVLFGTAAGLSFGPSGAMIFNTATTGLMGSGGAFSLGTALSSLSTGVGMLGSLSSSASQQENYAYQSHMANYNATIAENNATMAKRAAVYESDMHDERLNRLMGTQQTKYASSGVVINQDTPLQLSTVTAEDGALDRLAILYRGETQSKASQASATGQRFAALNAEQNAKRAKYAGYTDMATAGLGLLT